MNICKSHKFHDCMQVPTIQGQFWVYNYELYKDTKGYCSGKDDISQTLINEGTWEKAEMPIAEKALREGDRRKLVLDFGAHIGWYTILALRLGYRVIAFEADPENVRLLKANARDFGVEVRLDTRQEWVDETSSQLNIDNDIAFMKSDMEGADIHAVNVCRKLFEDRKIDTAMIEITPSFNDSYPLLVENITRCGYSVTDLERPGEPVSLDFNQSNFVFRKLS